MPSQQRKNTLATAALRAAAHLRDSPLLDAYQYLTEERGISRETLARFHIGLVPDDDPDFGEYAGWISIPYLTPTGFVDIRFRNPEPGGKPKYKSQPGAQGRIYNSTAILQARDTLVLAEGECLPPHAEVLTESGWVKFRDYEGQPVAQWDNGELSMVKPTAVVEKPYNGDLITYQWRGYKHTSTPGHRMPVIVKSGELTETTAEKGHATGQIPRVGILDGPGIDLTDDEIRLLVAISADGTIRDYAGRQYIVSAFTKARKPQRLVGLLDSLGMDYSSSPHKGGYWGVCFHMPETLEAFKTFPWEWIAQATARQRELILAELLEWDGNSVPNRTMHEYSSKHIENAEWVQALAHTAGRCSSIIKRHNEHGEWFKVTILNDKSTSSWQMAKKRRTTTHYEGTVHCVTVPSGFFLTRIDGIVSVTGNCDTMILSQIGLHAIGIPGASAWRKPFELAIHGFENIIICEDGDDSGAGAGLTATIVKGLDWAKTVRFEGCDVNDYYLQHGAQALRDKVLAPLGKDDE